MAQNLRPFFGCFDSILFLMENTIKGYLRGKTVIIITHLLHHLNNANNVIIIADGKISYKKNNTYPFIILARSSLMITTMETTKLCLPNSRIIHLLPLHDRTFVLLALLAPAR